VVAEYAEIVRRVARTHAVPLVEVHNAFLQAPRGKEMIPDGVHPDPEGHRLIAEILAPVLATVLSER